MANEVQIKTTIENQSICVSLYVNGQAVSQFWSMYGESSVEFMSRISKDLESISKIYQK